MKVSKYVVIYPNGETTVVENSIPDDAQAISLEMLQGEVEGYIEGVYSGDITMFCNEEGKLKNLETNPIASIVWWKLLTKESIPAGDILVGKVVITGGTDDEGETLGISWTQIDHLTVLIDEARQELKSVERIMKDIK